MILTVQSLAAVKPFLSFLYFFCLKKSSCNYCSTKNCWLYSLESLFPPRLVHAFISKKDCLIFSLCTDCIFNDNQFTNCSKVKMKPTFIKVDEGSLIPCSQDSDALSRVRREAEDWKKFQKRFSLKYYNSHRSIQLLYLSSFAINYK